MPCEAYSLVHSSKNCLQGLLDTLVTLTIQKPLADSCSGEIRVPQEHILLPAVAGILEFACVISAVSTGLCILLNCIGRQSTESVRGKLR